MDLQKEKKQDESDIKMRRVLIETDGINIKMNRGEVPSNLELQALLETILRKLIIK